MLADNITPCHADVPMIPCAPTSLPRHYCFAFLVVDVYAIGFRFLLSRFHFHAATFRLINCHAYAALVSAALRCLRHAYA